MQAELEKRAAGLDVKVSNPSRTMPNIAIQGPRSLEVVSKLAPGVDVAGLRYFNFFTEPVEFAGAQVMLTRTGYSGEKGYEVFLKDPADAERVYEAVLAENVTKIGTDAVLMYRAESGFVIAGVDYAIEADPKTKPMDIGLEHAIKMDHDFVGKDKIADSYANPAKRYVTLKLEGDEESGYAADVMHDGQKVGLGRSPAVSPKFGSITLADVPTELSAPGTEFEVEGRKAVADVNPLYDNKKERPRS
jgi:aminomethyltransferase